MKTIKISIHFGKFHKLLINNKKCKDMEQAIQYVRMLKIPYTQLKQRTKSGGVTSWDNF
jgi:hypothetical protein